VVERQLVNDLLLGAGKLRLAARFL